MNPPPSYALAHVWSRYVAIGDSFTEGMCDPDPNEPGRFVGWADRLAERLDAAAQVERIPFSYANLAVRGRKLDDVVGPQLDAALAMTPDLVSMVGGGNDILRPSVDLDQLAARLEEAVVTIRATGADVLLATPADTRGAGVFHALRGRHGIHSANIFSIAQRHGCHVLDLWGVAALQDWRLWADDRVHLTSEGHRRLAEAALLALGHPVGQEWRLPLPPAPATARLEQFAGHLTWLRAHAGPWVRRRMKGESSGDRLTAKRPQLAPVRDAGDGGDDLPDRATERDRSPWSPLND